MSSSKLWISIASNIKLFAYILYRCLSRWSCATSGKIPGSDGELESEKGRICLPQTFPILLTKVNDFKVNDPKNSGTFTYFHHSISSNSHVALWPFSFWQVVYTFTPVFTSQQQPPCRNSKGHKFSVLYKKLGNAFEQSQAP